MAKYMSDRAVESTVNQLVEAEQDRRAARGELDRFKAEHPPPEPPGAFQNLHAFIEYYRRMRWYEEEVAKREKRLATADELYAQAADRLQDVLPENVPLNYDYVGRRAGLRGMRYVIVKRQGKVIIPELGPSSGP